eukprot:Nk52_evm53s153 gene=Nk52_evmTU53s153
MRGWRVKALLCGVFMICLVINHICESESHIYTDEEIEEKLKICVKDLNNLYLFTKEKQNQNKVLVRALNALLEEKEERVTYDEDKQAFRECVEDQKRKITEIRRLKAASKDLEHLNKECSNHVTMKKEKIRVCRVSNMKLGEEKETVENELDEKKRTLGTEINEIAVEKGKMVAIQYECNEKNVKEITQNIEDYSSEIAELRKNIAQIENDLAQLKSENDPLIAENKSLENANDQLHEELKLSQSLFNSLSTSLQRLKVLFDKAKRDQEVAQLEFEKRVESERARWNDVLNNVCNSYGVGKDPGKISCMRCPDPVNCDPKFVSFSQGVACADANAKCLKCKDTFVMQNGKCDTCVDTYYSPSAEERCSKKCECGGYKCECTSGSNPNTVICSNVKCVFRSDPDGSAACFESTGRNDIECKRYKSEGGTCEENGTCKTCGNGFYGKSCVDICKCGGEWAGMKLYGGTCKFDGTCLTCGQIPGGADDVSKADIDNHCGNELVCGTATRGSQPKVLVRTMQSVHATTHYNCVDMIVTNDPKQQATTEDENEEKDQTKEQNETEQDGTILVFGDYYLLSRENLGHNLLFVRPSYLQSKASGSGPSYHRDIAINCRDIESNTPGAEIALIPEGVFDELTDPLMKPQCEHSSASVPFTTIVIDRESSSAQGKFSYSAIFAPNVQRGTGTFKVSNRFPSKDAKVKSYHIGSLLYVEDIPQVSRFSLTYELVEGKTKKATQAASDTHKLDVMVRIKLRKKNFRKDILSAEVMLRLKSRDEAIFIAVKLPAKGNSKCYYSLYAEESDNSSVDKDDNLFTECDPEKFDISPLDGSCTCKEGDDYYMQLTSFNYKELMCVPSSYYTKITPPMGGSARSRRVGTADPEKVPTSLKTPFTIGQSYFATGSPESSALLVSEDGAYWFRDIRIRCRYNADILLIPKSYALKEQTGNDRRIVAMSNAEISSMKKKLSSGDANGESVEIADNITDQLYAFIIDTECNYQNELPFGGNQWGNKTECKNGYFFGKDIEMGDSRFWNDLAGTQRGQPNLNEWSFKHFRVITNGDNFYVMTLTKDGTYLIESVGGAYDGKIKPEIGMPYFVGIRTDHKVGEDDTCEFEVLGSRMGCTCGGVDPYDETKPLEGGMCNHAGICAKCADGWYKGNDDSSCSKPCLCGPSGDPGGVCDIETGACTDCVNGYYRTSDSSTTCDLPCLCGGLTDNGTPKEGGDCNSEGICTECAYGFYKYATDDKVCNERCKCGGMKLSSPIYFLNDAEAASSEATTILPDGSTCSISGDCYGCREFFWKSDGKSCLLPCPCVKGARCDYVTSECLSCPDAKQFLPKKSVYKLPTNCAVCSACNGKQTLPPPKQTKESFGTCAFRTGTCIKCDDGYFMSPNEGSWRFFHTGRNKDGNLIHPEPLEGKEKSRWCIRNEQKVPHCREYQIDGNGNSMCTSCYPYGEGNDCPLSLYNNMCVCNADKLLSPSIQSSDVVSRCKTYDPGTGRCRECKAGYKAFCNHMKGYFYCTESADYVTTTKQWIIFQVNPHLRAHFDNTDMCSGRATKCVRFWSTDTFLDTVQYQDAAPFILAYGGGAKNSYVPRRVRRGSRRRKRPPPPPVNAYIGSGCRGIPTYDLSRINRPRGNDGSRYIQLPT